MSSLTSKKDIIPYENSVLTKLLADSLGIVFFLPSYYLWRLILLCWHLYGFRVVTSDVTLMYY